MLCPWQISLSGLGMYKTILVVGAEIQSTALDITTRGRNTAVIFGDGAGAAVLQAGQKAGILSTHFTF